MNYTKVRGHYSWWLKKEGKSIGQFNFNGLTSDEEAEAYVDEIVKLEAERDALQARLKQLEGELEEERQENASLRSGDDYERGAE